MTVCRYCGMDTRDPNVCEFCKRPLTAASTPQAAPATPMYASTAPQHTAARTGPSALDLTQPVPGRLDLTQPVPSMPAPLDLTQPVPQAGMAPPGPQVRVSLTGEVFEAPMPTAPPAPTPGLYGAYGGAAAPVGTAVMPPPGSAAARAHAVVRDLPPAAMGAHLAQSIARQEEESLGSRWERCLAILLPLALVGILAAHFAPPSAYGWIELTVLFFGALAMSATRAIDSYDEAFLDCTAVLILSYFFGPLGGLIGYLVVGAVKQELNAAIFIVLLVHVLTRAAFIFAAAPSQSLSVWAPEVDWALLLPHFSFFSIERFISFFVICSSVAGWMMGNFFRPVNE